MCSKWGENLKVPKYLFKKTIEIRNLQSKQKDIEDEVLKWFEEKGIDIDDEDFIDSVGGYISNGDYENLEQFQWAVDNYLRKLDRKS